MLTAIIIDDEENGRVSLSRKLEMYCPSVSLLGEAPDGEAGITLIKKHHPDIVFLDIEMPAMDGFEMLERLPRNDFHLVFTTAHDQYAIDAIKKAAFDYLLKPVDIEELKLAVERIAEDRAAAAAPAGNIAALRSMINRPEKLSIPTMDGLVFVTLSDIVHIEALDNYSVFHFLKEPKLTVSKTLKDFEHLLPPEQFFRVHNSHIVNVHFIKKYLRADGGQVALENGDLVRVSRRKRDDFLAWIG